MCEFPRAAIVSNRCWSVMMNKMSGWPICHSERERKISDCSKNRDRIIKPEMFRCGQHDSVIDRVSPLHVHQLTTGETTKRLNILCRTFFHHFLRQTRGRGSFVPVECLQIIAHKLLVEARRALPNRVIVFWPETGRIRCQTFVDQKKIITNRAELKFRVCDDDPTLVRMSAAA